MWGSRSRTRAACMGSAIMATALGTLLVAACKDSRGPLDGQGNGPGNGSVDAAARDASASSDASVPDGTSPDGAILDAAPPDAMWCKPPYDCPDAAGFDATPPTKDGATGTGPQPGTGFCGTPLIVYETHSLRATGGGAFATAYNAALDTSPFGPFVIQVAGGNGTATASFVATFSGAVYGAKNRADTTEPGAAYPYLFSQPSPFVGLDVPRAEHPFHLAFTRAVDVAGDIAVAGIELKGTMGATGCSSMQTVTATLYIAQSQANAPLGGSTVGQLLGATNATVAGGAGWAIPLAGASQEILLQ